MLSSRLSELPYQQPTIPGFEQEQEQEQEVGNSNAVQDNLHFKSSRLAVSDMSSRTPKSRHKNWPVGISMATGYIQYHFHCYQPARNVYRDYHLEYSSSLWGQHVVARRWGRRGGKERCAEREFRSQTEAVEYLRRQIAKRLKREYILVSAI